ncbi:hypothetical protein CBR_g4267 [Chara braunii]|uniref:Integrase catalytic domain-containing protein n=1 Tax=Chara braunii TaxID=69332 RepID=A0A388JRI4_CHABU|nr:hypothetical protein CBR_g4267 [Chara braunii]|eukprot:GBG60312.1 hypothetical protein CBR_g4267 [Chara braunii]
MIRRRARMQRREADIRELEETDLTNMDDYVRNVGTVLLDVVEVQDYHTSLLQDIQRSLAVLVERVQVTPSPFGPGAWPLVQPPPFVPPVIGVVPSMLPPVSVQAGSHLGMPLTGGFSTSPSVQVPVQMVLSQPPLPTAVSGQPAVSQQAQQQVQQPGPHVPQFGVAQAPGQGQCVPKTAIASPKPFSRDKKGEDLNNWLRLVPIYVKCKLTLPHEEVFVVASYQEGNAARWLSGELWKAAGAERGAQLQMTSGNHPKANGQADQLNRAEGKKLRPLEYMSKKMPSHKFAKSTYEKTLYAIYEVLTHWRHYLLGRFFYVRTDHRTMRWMGTQPVLSGALKRWIEVIEQYDVEPQYIKGEYNKVADALSRRPDFLGALITEFGLADNVTQSLVEAYREDPFMAEVICRLEAKDKVTSDEFVLVDGLVRASMDLMDTLVTSKSGMRYVFVIVDKFSKYARLVAMPETAKTEYIIRLFKENWVREYGLPKSIISDRDVRFASELWQATAAEQGTQLQMTSRNHPEANGQADQLNRGVQHLLRHYIKPNQVDWDEKLALIASLYNNVVHSATGVSPNSLPLTFKPELPLDFLLPENQSTAAPGTLEFAYRYESLMQQAVDSMCKAQVVMIESENKHRCPSMFQVGDRVWVKAPELGQEHGISRKLMPQYFGPWEVLDVVGDYPDGPSYVVQIPVASPLTDLTRLDTPWDWSDECEGAFKRLKHALMNHEVLMVPDPQKPFIVTTDASQYGIGAVLAQQDGKKLRPIEYMSKKMPSKKLAKSTYERELYALYKTIVHWRHFLLGRFFYLRTDHQTLKWIKTQPALSDALKRWIEVIDQYDFKLEYLKGEYNKVADALSRRADYLGALVSDFGVSDEVTQSLVGAYQEDPVTMDIIRKLQAKDKATESEFVMVDGLLYLDKAGVKRLVIPSSERLRSLFLGECHDATGHFGYKKTSANLVQRFWWPGMLDDAKKYVETCQVYQRDKPRTRAVLGLLKPLPIPAGPGQSVSMDFTLVTSKSGKRHIFVIIDRFTKYTRLVAMPETARTDHVIKLFKDNWVRDFGLTKTIVSDRDVRFTSELWKKTAEQMGSQLQMTSGNHPEANGQADQMNRVVQHLLRHYIKPSQDDWDEQLPLIASLYNNAVHSSTGVSPNELHLGWKPRSALDFLLPENRPAATPDTLEYGVQYEKLLQEAVEHMKKAQQAMIASENQHRRQSSFQVGNVSGSRVVSEDRKFGISRKLMPQYFGPWEVPDIVGDEMDGPTYVIRVPGHLRTYPVFHASKLAPFAETDQFPSRRSMLPPTMDGQVDIDDIVDHRDMPVPKPLGRGRPPKPKREYRVRFRHRTDPKEDRWFTKEELIETAPQVVAEYERKLKGKARAK